MGVVALCFLAFILKVGILFQHNYYIIPFVPIMALIAAYWFDQIKYNWLIPVLLGIGMVESLYPQIKLLPIPQELEYKTYLAQEKNDLDKLDAKTIIHAKDRNPQTQYLLEEKGWVLDLDKDSLSKVVKAGGRNIIFDKNEIPASINIAPIAETTNLILSHPDSLQLTF